MLVREIPLLPVLLYLLGLAWMWLEDPILASSCGFLFIVTTAQNTFRRGVWLGRHIFYKTTKVSKDKLSENRNLT